MLHNNIKRPVTLYWGAHSLKDLYMLALPDAWAKQYPHIKFISVLSDAVAEDNWQGRIGYVHQAVLDDFAKTGLADYEVYCCGAPAMVELAHASFVEAGLLEDEFFSDAFNYAKPAPKVTLA
jgi:CDP-4-dehydro-6-deoxyglucose reductase